MTQYIYTHYRHTTIVISKSFHINILSLWSANINFNNTHHYVSTHVPPYYQHVHAYHTEPYTFIKLTSSFQFQDPIPPSHHPRCMTSPY